MCNLSKSNLFIHFVLYLWIAVNPFSAMQPVAKVLAGQDDATGEQAGHTSGERINATTKSSRDSQSIKNDDASSDGTNPWSSSYYIRNAELISGDRKTEADGEMGGLFAIGPESFDHVTPERDREDLHQRHSRYKARLLRTTKDRIDLLCQNTLGEYFRVSLVRHDGKHYAFVSHLHIDLRDQGIRGPNVKQLTWRLEVDPFPADHFNSIMSSAGTKVVFGGKLDSESAIFTANQ